MEKYIGLGVSSDRLSLGRYRQAKRQAPPGACTYFHGEANPELVRRVANQMRLTRGESPQHVQVADTLEPMLMA